MQDFSVLSFSQNLQIVVNWTCLKCDIPCLLLDGMCLNWEREQLSSQCVRTARQNIRVFRV